MEGPTPVSALIHAATMVTAGVYLIARMHPLFELAPAAQDVGAVIGALTLLVAGTIGLVQTDIKRVIAYSTMSQIGYMIMGVSVGAYAAGLFHLMTHAFFKALLFMAAGSIIGAMAGEQSLDRMGGFRRAMPFTYGCFIIGGLALSGVPPFSGFFSKDEILLVTGERGGWHWALYVAGYIGAFLTAIYTFRMIFRAFHGEPVAEARELEEGHLHHAESPPTPPPARWRTPTSASPARRTRSPSARCRCELAMGVLAVGAVGAGLVQIPKVDFVVDDFLQPSFADSALYEPHTRNGLLWFGLALGTAARAGGHRARLPHLGRRGPGAPRRVRARLRPLYTLFVAQVVLRRADRCPRSCARPPRSAPSRATPSSGCSSRTRWSAARRALVRAGSAAVRAAQSGFVRYYAALLVLGVAGVGFYFLLQA